jgi:hypothetical protein
MLIRSSCYQFGYVPVCPPYHAGILEPEEKAVVRQRLGMHFPAATNALVSTRITVGIGVLYTVRVV